MEEPTHLAQEFLVDDLEMLKVIAHNTRLDILQSLKKPKTVKEIARLLKLPATKLYYHVNLMEKHGLIQVVETNIVSGIVEKKYYKVGPQGNPTVEPTIKEAVQKAMQSK